MEEKQGFTTFDTFSVVGLVVGVGMLVFSIVSSAMTSQNAVKAEVESQRIALQILGGGLQYSSSSAEPQAVRGPANLSDGLEVKGRMGIDPWGEPYYYRVYSDVNGKKSVVVFSAGPDQKPDTNDNNFIVNSDGALVSAIFIGDDIGTVQKSWP